MKLTDEKIAELAPDWATHYNFDTSSIVFFDIYNAVSFNFKRKKMTDKFCNRLGIHRDDKPIPRKKFDISEYEFNDESVYYDRGAESLYLGSDDSEILLIKQDVVALAKHFKLTAEDLK